MLRAAATLALLAAFAPSASAQPVNLAEAPAAGDAFRYSVELDLAGKLHVVHDGMKESLKLEAKARHLFTERTLAVDAGLPTRSARHYDDAVASVVVDAEKMGRALPDNRRLVVALRTAEGPFCFAPAGPLTRDELDLVTEHFNPQCLAGLLPGKAVNAGDTWPVSPEAAQAACLFDALIKHSLAGKFTASADGSATFTIEGTAEGIENGGKVTLTVTATGTFDIATKRVVALVWKQKDDREQGPVAPASNVEVTVTVKREALAEVPKELADAVLATVPKGAVPAELSALRHDDPKARYTLTYPRDWHVTGQTEQHLILRLLDKGEFVAQATVMPWAQVEQGKHTSADDFKKAASATPGWTAARVLEDAEGTDAAGRWAYRYVAEGKLDGAAAVQSFQLVAGPSGHQAAVLCALKPERAKAFGTRDRDLLNGLLVPAKK